MPLAVDGRVINKYHDSEVDFLRDLQCVANGAHGEIWTITAGGKRLQRAEMIPDNKTFQASLERSLKAFAKRFGLDVTDDVDGADIHRLVQEGRWEAVEAHVTSDIELTIGLAQKLGYRLSWAKLEPAEQVL